MVERASPVESAPIIPSLGKSAQEQEEALKYYTATQFQLIWWRFRKHRLALLGSSVLGLFLIIVLFAEFLAPLEPFHRNSDYIYGPPQKIRFIDIEGRFHITPFIYRVENSINIETFTFDFVEDTSQRLPIRLFTRGDAYKLWGMIRTDLHLFGVEGGFIHLLGTDKLGRDLLSRAFLATRVSLSIGVIGMLISFFLGLFVGGISGYFGGAIDEIAQRFIEFIRSIPALPILMAVAASMPKEWSPLQVYFGITLILGMLGWTNLARRVRSKLISLQDTDFVVAAKIAGSSDTRIITHHMLPSFFSYIIVDLSISFPYMILGETSLSFIGLGLRPPVVSWGVLLHESQNIKAISQYPWLFTPVIFVILAILAFNFVGDGMRDAADPYST